jgi:hypothetical protein
LPITIIYLHPYRKHPKIQCSFTGWTSDVVFVYGKKCLHLYTHIFMTFLIFVFVFSSYCWSPTCRIITEIQLSFYRSTIGQTNMYFECFINVILYRDYYK